MAQSGKCLSHKHKDLSTPVKCQIQLYRPEIPMLRRQREETLWCLLASQSRQVGDSSRYNDRPCLLK